MFATTPQRGFEIEVRTGEFPKGRGAFQQKRESYTFLIEKGGGGGVFPLTINRQGGRAGIVSSLLNRKGRPSLF